jgi:hypothetical protein
MTVTKKNAARKRTPKKGSTVTVVTKTYISPEQAIFPEKTQKVKEILSKAKFRSA